MAYLNVKYPGNANGFISKVNWISNINLIPDALADPWINLWVRLSH